MENFVLFFSLLPFLLSSSHSSIDAADEALTLIQFKKFSIEQDPKGFLQNWNEKNDFCSWTGIQCSQPNGSVQGLNLSNMELIGRLQIDTLMMLPSLQNINFHGNFFYGNLNYTNNLPCSLVNIDLSSNNFSEIIFSPFLSSCTHLSFLNLSRNSIPAGIFPFGSSIRVLDVSKNRIFDEGLLNFSLSSCQGLTYLDLSDNKLTGKLRTLPAYCAELSVLDLSVNSIYDEIPANFISSLPASLNLLNLSHNNLTSNFAVFDFAGCGNIKILDLSFNNLQGSGLPDSLQSCRKLEQLSFAGNNFTNQVPTFWEKFTNLKYLDLSNNNFSGEIPAGLAAACKNLTELNLSNNNLTGGLPTSFSACSNLQTLDLSNNNLSGNFVEQVIAKLPLLKKLRLAFNNISGDLPLHALSKCNLLEEIDLSSNEFTGNLSAEFCKSLPLLEKLLLADNSISGSVPSQLGLCTNLQSIHLSFNNLAGDIPLQVWSLPKLVNIVMWANKLTGEIPPNLCSQNPNLEMLVLNLNSLTGKIPFSLTKCSKLIWVSLAGNQLNGEIPPSIGTLKNLAILQLGNNSLSGNIPPELGNCQNLIWLDLNSNKLTGQIPPSLSSQSGLISSGIVSGKQFAFLRNEAGNICPGAGTLFEFQGIRPDRLASLPLGTSCPSTRIYRGTTVYTYRTNGTMMYLDLSYNNLAGQIPPSLGLIQYLLVLNLGHNSLSGIIPNTFGALKMLGVLDLSYNYLTGPIPPSLGSNTFLNDLDLSNNNLSGQIPTSGQLITFPPSRYANNSYLCGIPLPPCNSFLHKNSTFSHHHHLLPNSTFILLLGITFSLLILLLLALALFKLKKHRKKPNEITESTQNTITTQSSKLYTNELTQLTINVAAFEKHLRKLTFAHLLEATSNFSADTLIGSGGFGEVYLARLKDNTIVAVKKLIHITGQGDREFTAEMETIGKIKHRNLVPLLGYCKVGDERLLVYEYMRFGSLDIALQKSKVRAAGAPRLDWSARKKIAIGSARGLAFLHHSCIPHIIHRDMKSSNVLLDENLEARVSDFGMARLMNAVDTHLSVSTLAGTPGYVPPEYYQSFRCTTKGDVYSYGVVLLELLSGKKPIDTVEFGDNNLVGWAKNLLKENKCGEIFDLELVEGGVEELFKYLKIAFLCVEDRPLRRPTMIQVMAMFKELQIDSDGSDLLDGFSIRRSVIEESV